MTGGAWGEKCYCSMDAKPHSMMMKFHMQSCKPQLFDTTHIITGTSASLPFEVQVCTYVYTEQEEQNRPWPLAVRYKQFWSGVLVKAFTASSFQCVNTAREGLMMLNRQRVHRHGAWQRSFLTKNLEALPCKMRLSKDWRVEHL